MQSKDAYQFLADKFPLRGNTFHAYMNLSPPVSALLDILQLEGRVHCDYWEIGALEFFLMGTPMFDGSW